MALCLSVSGSSGAVGDISFAHKYEDCGLKETKGFLGVLQRGGMSLQRQIRGVSSEVCVS